MMQNRIALAEYLKERKFTTGVEIGVATGRYSEILLQKNPFLKSLVCVDPFYRKGHYESTVATLEKYKDRVTIIRETSMKAVLDFPDETFDFVFIDGNHSFDYVMEDIIGWSRKVAKGGIISGHDYYHFHHSGVIEAVNKYCEIHKLVLNLTEWDFNGHIDDKCPCWWFEKK